MVRSASWSAGRTRWRIAIALAELTVVLFLIIRAADISLARVPESPDQKPGWLPFVGVGTWDTAGELAWERAYTGWESVGSPSLPTIDKNFLRGPLTIAGAAYEAGLGTYPSSEIEFDLGGKYSVLEVAVGIDDASAASAGAFFSIEVDGSPVYVSPGMRRGQAAKRLSIPLTDARSLLLVTAKDPDARAIGLTNWADFRLFQTIVPIAGAPSAVALGASRLRSILGARDRSVGSAERDMLAAVAGEEREYVAARVGEAPGVAAIADADRQRFTLANQHVALIYEAAGEEPNSFTILDLREPRVLLHRASLRITLDETRDIFLTRDAVIEEDNVRFLPVDERGFGRGQSLEVRLRIRPGEGGVVVLRMALFQDVRHFLFQADLASASRSRRIDYAFFQRLAGPPLVLGKREIGSPATHPTFPPWTSCGS